MSIARRYTSFTQREIRNLFKNAIRLLKVPELTILIAPTTLSFGRVLVVVPRSVGNAPTRNRIRRQLKSYFYEQKFFLHGHDWVIIVKPTTLLSWRKIQELMKQAEAMSKTKQPDPI